MSLPIWEGEHLTELALVALADGQNDLVPEDARTHVDACEACAHKLADFAIESALVGQAIVPAPRRMPVKAIAIAIVLALVGVIPSLLEPAWASAVTNAPHSFAMFLTAFAASIRTLAQGPIATAATYGAALLFLVSGALVARQRRAFEVRS